MQKLYIYNTMSRKKEEFVPLMNEGKKENVGIYTCGPTVYWEPHIGNLRAYVFADILRGTLRDILGYPVLHVVNITDVGHLVGDGDDGEDKMEKGARIEKLSAWDVAKKYENSFCKNLQMINIELFDVMPRATEHINEQIEMVKILESKGYTYNIPGDGIYMDTSKVVDYGKLAKLDIDGLEGGKRVQIKGKKNITDFALWKHSPKDKKRQMEWDSPWGTGFPGWHIECSAMSNKYLGEEFDIHTGGIDHIPVHHTNEITQSTCVFGTDKWVKYWMHSQFLTIKGEKAAKSTGNVVFLKEIKEKGFDPLDMRYFFLQAHYRSFIDFTFDGLKAASKGRQKLIEITVELYKKYSLITKQIDSDQLHGDSKSFEEFLQKLERQKKILPGDLYNKLTGCINKLLDDLNTPELLGDLYSIFKEYNNSSIDDNTVIVLLKFVGFLDCKLLKLNIIQSAINKLQEEDIKSKTTITEEFTVGQTKYYIKYDTKSCQQSIVQLAKDRWIAKVDKEFEKSDTLRKQIADGGYDIIDEKEGFILII